MYIFILLFYTSSTHIDLGSQPLSSHTTVQSHRCPMMPLSNDAIVQSRHYPINQ